MSLEFELPLFSFIFLSMLCIFYFARPKIKVVENKYFEIILRSSLINSIINTVIHFICSVNDFETINLKYYTMFNFLNKILIIMFVSLFSALLCYTIIISYKQVREKPKLVYKGFVIFNIIFAIATLFTNIELIEVGSVINVTGSTTALGYTVIGLLAGVSLLVALLNIKKYDKRFFSIFFILFLVSFLALLTILFPGIIIYDAASAIFCYVMYFTIENPDVKMINRLEIAKDQADKANRAKTDFLSSMSHEIRTPLNAIVGFSDYIMTAESLDEAKENAKDIVNASNTLLEIVNSILDISKIEAGKLEIVNSKYNAKNTFEGLAKLITPKMKEKGLDFSYYIAPDLPETLFGDHANIKKVITNLLSNAYKYTDKGSVRYEVNCINSANVTKLIITVEDTGRGIKQESIDKLFTKFQRLDEDRNTTIEGTGLGLAITKQLTELMGGKVLVHTVYGEGSKFTVVLNQQIEKNPVENSQEKTYTTLDLKDKKILLVDDNALNIKVANKILERFNANNITSLDNGYDCLERIKNGEVYDIILMDDMMPKMNGVETLQKLKKLPGFNQPVVILTANAITGMKEKYLNEGFDDYLAKPIDKTELIRVCNIIFSKNNSTKEKIQKKSSTEELEIIDENESKEPKLIGNETYLRENDVDIDKALEFLGDIEMYNMTIADFLSEIESKWQSIIEYKNNNDMENYAIEVHSLKSDAKYLGFTSLAEVSYQHELKSKDNDSTYINEHFNELEIEYSKALEIAKNYNKMIN